MKKMLIAVLAIMLLGGAVLIFSHTRSTPGPQEETQAEETPQEEEDASFESIQKLRSTLSSE